VHANRNSPQPSFASAKGNSFGDLLRRAREARGVALGAVANATRIARHHLDALERSDLDALPSGPFGKAYIRAYADVLRIDPEPILEAYRTRERQRAPGTGGDEQRMLAELSQLVARRTATERRRPRLGTPPRSVAVGVLMVGILVALGWLLALGRAPQMPVAASPPPPGRPSPAAAVRPRPVPGEAPAASAPGKEREREAAGARTSRAPSAPPPTDALQVPDHGVGTGFVERRLVGRGDRFPEGTQVSFWNRVLGGRPGHVIRHVWLREGRAVMRSNLPVGGSHWRTQSSLLLPRGSAGRWTVEARTSDGRLLARDSFLCVAEPAPAERGH
jgi:cytoskeletal protein RodZ